VLNPGRFEILEQRLQDLREHQDRLLVLVPQDRKQEFLAAARGLDYAFKSQVLVERALGVMWRQAALEREPGGGEHATDAELHLPDVQGYLTEATLRSLHSSADVLAQVLNLALLQEPMAADECSLLGVRKSLRDLANGNEPPSSLIRAIDGFTGSADFQYLNAFANYCKHHGFVGREHVTRILWDNSVLSDTALRGFTYKSVDYSARTFDQLEGLWSGTHGRCLAVLDAAVAVASDKLT
jgi:hypothetical protein